jgi:type IV secretory pathway VirJ component
VSSLRQLIESKARRTASLPILVGDAEGAAMAVAVAVQALQEHLAAAGDDPGDEQRAAEQTLRDGVKQALAAQRETVIEVRLQALPDDEWDAIFGDIEPDEDGEISLDDFRAVLLAASCVDEELRDAAWWESQLARPEWTKGDKLAINNLLLGLNLRVPEGPAGKG